jgi:protein translocase SecG subunit
MQQVLIVIHLILVTALVGVVLLQRSEGGALGMGGSGNGGSGGFMTGRGQANALTRATAILATGFFITSLLLAVVASSNRQPKSILDSARRVFQQRLLLVVVCWMNCAVCKVMPLHNRLCQRQRRLSRLCRRHQPRADISDDGFHEGPVCRPFLFVDHHA